MTLRILNKLLTNDYIIKKALIMVHTVCAAPRGALMYTNKLRCLFNNLSHETAPDRILRHSRNTFRKRLLRCYWLPGNLHQWR